jgi:hypothetical protein
VPGPVAVRDPAGIRGGVVNDRERAAVDAMSKVLGDAGWPVPRAVRERAGRAAVEAADRVRREELARLCRQGLDGTCDR